MPQRLDRLKQRKDFLRVAAGRRKFVTAGLILQAAQMAAAPAPSTPPAAADRVRVGFTASKKIGNAVARNRAKRRLRAAAREVLTSHAAPAHDYVVIARNETIGRPYTSLLRDLEQGLRRLGAWRDDAGPSDRSRSEEAPGPA
jgi:ribonuclease P protein component